MITQNSLNEHSLIRNHKGKVETLVENRHSFSFCHSELNYFQTHEAAHQVALTFEHPVLAIMLSGRKEMHLAEKDFPFYPGESVILQGGSTMVIDFPEAQRENPTSCLALEISQDLVDTTLNRLNEQVPKAQEGSYWQMEEPHFHFQNAPEIYGATRRLFDLYQSPTSLNKQLEFLTLQELVLRIMQTQAKNLILEDASGKHPQSRLAQVIAYMDARITGEVSMEELAQVACMSKPHFFRAFKNEMGVSPLFWFQKRKIQKACKELDKPKNTISDVAWALGFNQLGYFSRVFKKLTGISPVAYKMRNHNKISQEIPPLIT